MSIINESTKMKTKPKVKIEDYIAKTVLVLITFDDTTEIYRALNTLAKEKGLFPEELVLINIGVKAKLDITQALFSTRMKTDGTVNDFFLRTKSLKKEETYKVTYSEDLDFNKYANKNLSQGKKYKFPYFTKDHITTINPVDFIEDKNILTEQIKNIYNVIQSKEKIFRKVSVALPTLPIQEHQMEETIRLQKECKIKSLYFRSFNKQTTQRIKSNKKIKFNLDIVCDEYSIHLCIAKTNRKLIINRREEFEMNSAHTNTLFFMGFLAGFISREHDTTSTLESYYRRAYTGILSMKGEFFCDESDPKIQPPKYILRYNSKLTSSEINRSVNVFNKEPHENEEVFVSEDTADEGSNEELETPEIEFYTAPDNVYGTLKSPTFVLAINALPIYLSAKDASYIYCWLELDKSMHLRQNKELGFIKAQYYCLLLGATEYDIESPISVIRYIAEIAEIKNTDKADKADKAPSKMEVLIGKAWKKMPVKLKKELMQPSLKNSELIDDEIKLFLEKERIGGYLGGNTENKDKTNFMKTVAPQLDSKIDIEWLTPKVICKGLDSEDRFNEERKTKDKNDLVNFLRKKGQGWEKYKAIIERFKGSNEEEPKGVKKYVNPLFNHEIIDDEWRD